MIIESPAVHVSAEKALIADLEAALAQGELALERHQLPAIEAAIRLTMKAMAADLEAAKARLATAEAEAAAEAATTREERVVALAVDAAARRGGSMRLAKPIQRRLALAILALCGQDGGLIPHTLSAQLPGVGHLVLTDEWLSLDVAHRDVLDSRCGGVDVA
jgi:hypothetical protein